MGSSRTAWLWLALAGLGLVGCAASAAPIPSRVLEGLPRLVPDSAGTYRSSGPAEGVPTLYGFVVTSTGERLESVQVYARDSPVGALSVNDGSYRFTLPGPGPHWIVAQILGYATDSVLIQADSTAARVDFMLEGIPLCLMDCLIPDSAGTMTLGCC